MIGIKLHRERAMQTQELEPKNCPFIKLAEMCELIGIETSSAKHQKKHLELVSNNFDEVNFKVKVKYIIVFFIANRALLR